MKKVVITGATGAIGRALILVCIEAGYEVLAVVHKTSKRTGDLQLIKHCRLLYLDLTEYDYAMDEMIKLGIALDNYVYFFHLAWMAPFGEGRNDFELQLKNVKASLAAVRLAKALGCSVFVGAGSQAEYGRVTGKLSPETPTFPETGYGVAKLCAGQMTRLACEQINRKDFDRKNVYTTDDKAKEITLRHIWARILSVYGPHDGVQSLISVAIDDMINNRETSFTLCEQIWDYVYSEDAARAMLLMAQKGRHGSVYVIGSGESHPLKEYIIKIAELTNYKKKIGFGRRPYNNKQVMYLQADIDELKVLGFEPRISFEDGIKKLINWRE